MKTYEENNIYLVDHYFHFVLFKFLKFIFIIKDFFKKLYNFKGYIPFTDITKYWLYSHVVQHIFEPIFHQIVYTSHSLNPTVPLPPILISTSLYSKSMNLLLFCYSHWFIVFLDSTYKWYHRVFFFLWLISLDKHNAL